MADEQNRIFSLAQARARGLERYWTGKPCKRDHICFRRVSTRVCLECSREHWKAYDPIWKAKNPDKRKASNKRFYNRHKDDEEFKRKIKERAEKDFDKNKERYARWKSSNLERVKQTARNSYLKNKEARTEWQRKWLAANPEKKRATHARRRARRRNAEGHHTAEQLKNLMKQQKYRCAYCRCSLRGGYHADHIVPLSKGGSNWIANIQLTCGSCNARKHTADPIDYARSRGLLL